MKKIIFWFLLIFSFSTSHTQATELACTREYMPVCGIDWVTYGNSCTAGDMTIAYQWECKWWTEKSETKPSETATCSSYNNGCNTCNAGENWIAACTLMFCEEQGQPYCLSETEPTMCTMQYDPVCGMSNDTVVTYGNACGAGVEKAQVLHRWECVAENKENALLTVNQRLYRDSLLARLSHISSEQRATLIVALQERLENQAYLLMVSTMTAEQNSKHMYIMHILGYLIEKLSMHN